MGFKRAKSFVALKQSAKSFFLKKRRKRAKKQSGVTVFAWGTLAGGSPVSSSMKKRGKLNIKVRKNFFRSELLINTNIRISNTIINPKKPRNTAVSEVVSMSRITSESRANHEQITTL